MNRIAYIWERPYAPNVTTLWWVYDWRDGSWSLHIFPR